MTFVYGRFRTTNEPTVEAMHHVGKLKKVGGSSQYQMNWDSTAPGGPHDMALIGGQLRVRAYGPHSIFPAISPIDYSNRKRPFQPIPHPSARILSPVSRRRSDPLHADAVGHGMYEPLPTPASADSTAIKPCYSCRRHRTSNPPY